MNRTLTFIKSLLRYVGLEVKFYNIYSSEFLHLVKLLSFHNIGTIVDVGANTGQYAMNIRESGYKGRIISFEPLSDAYRQLKRNCRRDSNWTVAGQVALGNQDGEAEINVSANAVSSSLLPMTDVHKNTARNSIYIGKEKIAMRRLDSLLDGLEQQGNTFLKIDAQGYELEVLRGASRFLASATGLQVELSFVELYAGQAMWQDMITYLEHSGFELHALFPAFLDESSGRMLQVDGVFFRK